MLEIVLWAKGGGDDAKIKTRWTDVGDEGTLHTNLYNIAWSDLAEKLWEYESEVNGK